MQSQFRLIVLCLVFWIFTAVSVRGEGELLLKLDGPDATQETHTVVTQVLSYNNRNFRTVIDQRVTTDKTFKKVADGFESSHRIKTITVDLTPSDGRKISFPSPASKPDDPEAASNEGFLANYGQLIGAAWTVKRDNGLKVTEIQLDKKFEDNLPKWPAIIRSRFSKQTIEQTEVSEQGRLPGRLVKANDSWNADSFLFLEGDNKLRLGVKYTYIERYMEGGRDLHRVKFVVDSVRYEPDANADVRSSGAFRLDPKQASKGEYSYDAAWGQIVKINEDIALEGSLRLEDAKKVWKVDTALKLHLTRASSLRQK